MSEQNNQSFANIDDLSLQEAHKVLFKPDQNAVKNSNNSASFEIYSAFDSGASVRFACNTGDTLS